MTIAVSIIWEIDTFSGEADLLKLLNLPFKNGSSLSEKNCSSMDANSFLLMWALFQKLLCCTRKQKEVG